VLAWTTWALEYTTGSASWSMTRHRRPRRVSSIAIARPVGPAPTIKASMLLGALCMSAILRRDRDPSQHHQHRRGEHANAVHHRPPGLQALELTHHVEQPGDRERDE